jgi:hypothetical protein
VTLGVCEVGVPESKRGNLRDRDDRIAAELLRLGVVVALTDAGADRLAETWPVHARGLADLFVSRLDDPELALLESTLMKVALECDFG